MLAYTHPAVAAYLYQVWAPEGEGTACCRAQSLFLKMSACLGLRDTKIGSNELLLGTASSEGSQRFALFFRFLS